MNLGLLEKEEVWRQGSSGQTCHRSFRILILKTRSKLIRPNILEAES